MISLEFSFEIGFQNTFCCFVRFGIAPKSQNRRHLTKHLSQYFQNKGSVTEPDSHTDQFQISVLIQRSVPRSMWMGFILVAVNMYHSLFGDLCSSHLLRKQFKKKLGSELDISDQAQKQPSKKPRLQKWALEYCSSILLNSRWNSGLYSHTTSTGGQLRFSMARSIQGTFRASKQPSDLTQKQKGISDKT